MSQRHIHNCVHAAADSSFNTQQLIFTVIGQLMTKSNNNSISPISSEISFPSIPIGRPCVSLIKCMGNSKIVWNNGIQLPLLFATSLPKYKTEKRKRMRMRQGKLPHRSDAQTLRQLVDSFHNFSVPQVSHGCVLCGFPMRERTVPNTPAIRLTTQVRCGWSTKVLTNNGCAIIISTSRS